MSDRGVDDVVAVVDDAVVTVAVVVVDVVDDDVDDGVVDVVATSATVLWAL